MNLSNPKELRSIIEAFGFSFSKGLGQNFLIDKNVLNEIVEGSGINENYGVLEIGPGAGTLTRELAQNSKKTVAVEIDTRLLPLLNYTVGEFRNFKLINEDIMKVDLNKLIEEEFGDMPVAVVANLPYYITTPIIMKILETCNKVKSITVMIQKEVADRMIAEPGGKDYGALTVAVQYYTKPKIITRATPDCFMPPPKVASTVIHLAVLDEPSVKAEDTKKFFSIVKSAFGQRRKTLMNALSKSPYLSAEKTDIERVLTEMGLDINIRGEKLSLSDFAELSNKL